MGAERRFESTFTEVTGWLEGGTIERFPGASKGLKGRIRSVWEARSFVQFPRPDVIWTSAGDAASWFTWANCGPFRVPLIFDTDASYSQLNEMSREYYNREPTKGLAFKLRTTLEHQLLKQVAVATPWSRWAAKGLVDAGLSPKRIRVSPPGVDLDRWVVPGRQFSLKDAPLRMLFVGGDFHRKGGDLLLEAIAGPLDGLVRLDVVTRDEVAQQKNVKVHRAEANSREIVERFADADVFVLPSRAECFGLASVEALASGLPVIASNVGGTRDIVKEGRNGWLLEPTVESIVSRVNWILEHREWLVGASIEARRTAQEEFDGRQRTLELANLILELAGVALNPGREHSSTHP